MEAGLKGPAVFNFISHLNVDDYWQKEPSFGEDIPGFSPFLVDRCSKEESYVWYQFAYGGIDLDVEMCAHEQEGELPEWFDWQMDGAGTAFFIDPDLPCVKLHTQYGTFDSRMASYATMMGIAPYQPFLIRFDEPICGWYTTYHGDEYDFEPMWDFEKVLPISRFEALRRWEWWFAARNRTIQIAYGNST